MNTTRMLSFATAIASVLIAPDRAQDSFVPDQVAIESRVPLKASAIAHGDLDASSLNPSGHDESRDRDRQSHCAQK